MAELARWSGGRTEVSINRRGQQLACTNLYERVRVNVDCDCGCGRSLAGENLGIYRRIPRYRAAPPALPTIRRPSSASGSGARRRPFESLLQPLLFRGCGCLGRKDAAEEGLQSLSVFECPLPMALARLQRSRNRQGEFAKKRLIVEKGDGSEVCEGVGKVKTPIFFETIPKPYQKSELPGTNGGILGASELRTIHVNCKPDVKAS